MKKVYVATLLCLCVITFIGCAEMVKNKKPDAQAATVGLLSPQSSTRFLDIPVPERFKLLIEESYSFENSGVRVGLLKYQGKANIDSVLNFYKEQMPMYNWNLLNIIEYGQRLLNFEREQESCIITLLPKGGAVVITISLGPKSQPMGKKSREPIK